MRSCIYCGRELEKGEVCGCPQSAAYRASKNKDTGDRAGTSGNAYHSNPYRTENTYQTGYAGKESKFERARNRFHTRRAAKKTANRVNTNPKGFIQGLMRYMAEFIQSPVDKITNPGHIGKAAIMTIAALQGAVLWLCVFFVMRGGAVSPFKMLASAMGFTGGGYELVGMVLLIILSGALSGMVLFFLYSGIFYFINRFLMRLRTPYWQFSVRLACTWIPFTVVCALGAVLSILSPVTLEVLMMCGAVSAAVLSYEALKTEWISQPAGKVLYAMILGYFIFFVIVSHLLLI